MRTARLAGPGLAAALATACAGAPGGDAKVPEYAPKDQTTALAAKSATRPLILQWPAADRAALEAQRASGVVVVRYSGREMEVLRGCRVAAAAPVAYRYVALTPKEEDVVMRNASELAAAMPIHAVRLEARFEQKQKLEVAMTIVGMYETEPRAWRAPDLRGDCAGATHVVAALTVGAFELSASAEAAAGASAGAFGAGAGARQESQKEVLDRDGMKAACAQTSGSDAAPPHACGALLRVEVAPIEYPQGPARAACAPGQVLKGDACVAVDPGRPALLDVLQGGSR